MCTYIVALIVRVLAKIPPANPHTILFSIRKIILTRTGNVSYIHTLEK